MKLVARLKAGTKCLFHYSVPLSEIICHGFKRRGKNVFEAMGAPFLSFSLLIPWRASRRLTMPSVAKYISHRKPISVLSVYIPLCAIVKEKEEKEIRKQTRTDCPGR